MFSMFPDHITGNQIQTMENLLAYVEDPNFVRWVYAPTEESNLFWAEFKKNNPNEAINVREARAILLRLKSKDEVITEKIDSTLPLIFKRIEKKKRILEIRKLSISAVKYAAVAFLFFLTGSLIMQQKYRSALDEMGQQFANISYYNGEDSRLILADGKNIIINEKHSTVRYNENGTIVIDHQDTVMQKFNAENTMNQLVVPYGKNSSITLSDGTVAYLNAGSRLVFPPVFKQKTREVLLVGEGYFHVAHNPDRPFIVNTTKLEVEAVGTQFNVSAYPTENKIEVVLAEGKVNINKKEFGIFQKQTTMHPNDMICYNKTVGEMDYKKVKTENYTSWHEGYINCESVELHKITTKMERYYDVNIYFGNPETEQKKITGKLKLQSDIDAMLNVLAATTTLNIEKISEHEYMLK